MVFKQKVLKEEIIKLVTGVSSAIIIPFLIIIVLVIIYKDDMKLFLAFSLVIYLPTLILMLFLALAQLEWYHIYPDRIAARGILGVKNVVYFENVLFVEKVQIPLTSRGMYKPFFIFNDGRKNNGNILDYNSCYNRKRYNLRIYATSELAKYIETTLFMEIK